MSCTKCYHARVRHLKETKKSKLNCEKNTNACLCINMMVSTAVSHAPFARPGCAGMNA